MLKVDEVEVLVMLEYGDDGRIDLRKSMAIRLIHKPTGLDVECDEFDSQVLNKEKAWQILEEKVRTHLHGN